jgi:cytochrome c oxidase subunit 4
MENEKHVVPYSTYVVILILLLIFTSLSVLITHINLGSYSVAGALIFSSLKSALVLTFFMHLKFDKPYIRIMVGFVILLFLALLLITFLDYYYR